MYVEAGLIPAYRSPEVVQWPGGDKPRPYAGLQYIVCETALSNRTHLNIMLGLAKHLSRTSNQYYFNETGGMLR